jgi:tripartite-type tricarboxylate transporter receptor subunit TctC
MRLDYKPYRGLAPLLNDMMGEQVGAAIVPVGAIVGLREPNSIKPLAITAPHKAMPGLPTFEQAGIGEATFNDWLGVLAPASTPASIVSRLNLAVNRIVQMNEVQDRLTSLGLMPQLSSPEQFGTLIKLYSNRMATVIRQEGIQIS